MCVGLIDCCDLFLKNVVGESDNKNEPCLPLKLMYDRTRVYFYHLLFLFLFIFFIFLCIF